MPMTTWNDIIGEKCVVCDKWASHWYADEPLCCQCHEGDLCTEEETSMFHEFHKAFGFIPSSELVTLIISEKYASRKA